MTVTFQPLLYMQGVSVITALSSAASSYRKPATTRTSCDGYSAQNSNKRNTIMRLFYRKCALSYCSMSCLAPCCSHIISNSMWLWKRSYFSLNSRVVQLQIESIHRSIDKWRQLLLHKKTEPNHITECSVKRIWLKILKSLTHTHTHFTGDWCFKNFCMNCYKLVNFKPRKDNCIHLLHIT